MRRKLAAAAGVAAALAGGALAAATPESPTPGAVVSSSRPAFSWTLPANERSNGIFIADSPDRTTDGKFEDANIVEAAAFSNDERQWSPSNPLYAGHYWWLVWSTDRTTAESFYSAPSDFTIPASLTLLSVKTVRSTFLHLLAVRVRWSANVHALTVRARVLKRRRVVWTQTQPQVNKIGFSYSTSFGWYRPRRIRQGTALKLEITLQAQGVRKTRALVVRAP